MSTKRAADQLGYPASILLIDRATDRRYYAIAITAEEPCDPDHVGACCYIGQHTRPRYLVDGVECPDFDPTIPDDLRNEGWFWHGGGLSWPPEATARVAIGMPVESLDEVWKKARAVAKVHADHEAARQAEQEKAAQKKQKKPKPGKPAVKATTTPTDPADPRSYPCPSCGAKPGSPCKRPSGHTVFGGGYHAPRQHSAAPPAPAAPPAVVVVDRPPVEQLAMW